MKSDFDPSRRQLLGWALGAAVATAAELAVHPKENSWLAAVLRWLGRPPIAHAEQKRQTETVTNLPIGWTHHVKVSDLTTGPKTFNVEGQEVVVKMESGYLSVESNSTTVNYDKDSSNWTLNFGEQTLIVGYPLCTSGSHDIVSLQVISTEFTNEYFKLPRLIDTPIDHHAYPDAFIPDYAAFSFFSPDGLPTTPTFRYDFVGQDMPYQLQLLTAAGWVAYDTSDYAAVFPITNNYWYHDQATNVVRNFPATLGPWLFTTDKTQLEQISPQHHFEMSQDGQHGPSSLTIDQDLFWLTTSQSHSSFPNNTIHFYVIKDIAGQTINYNAIAFFENNDGSLRQYNTVPQLLGTLLLDINNDGERSTSLAYDNYNNFYYN